VRCFGRDSKATPPEYKSKALPLKQPAQSNAAKVLLENRYLLNSAKNCPSLMESEVPFLSLQKPQISHVYFILLFTFLIPHTHIWPFQESKTLKYTKLETQNWYTSITREWTVFGVSKSVHHPSYDSNKLTNKMQQFHKFITWRFGMAQHVSGAPRPSSGAYNCINSFWFYRWSVTVAALFFVVWPA
jgi:hypothetical protein